MPREIPYIGAVQEAIRVEMERDPTVVFYGQDVAPSDEDPLVKAFGRDRVRVSPMSETAEIGETRTRSRPKALTSGSSSLGATSWP